MYPMYGPAGNGFLRLHSTYRHDLKIYTSDEGRVQTSAAAFTQGLLDLEGTSLTPILVRYGPSAMMSRSCFHALVRITRSLYRFSACDAVWSLMVMHKPNLAAHCPALDKIIL